MTAMVDRRRLTGWKRFQPTADDPMKYKVPNPKSAPKEIGGSHGHRPHGKSILWPALYEHLRRKGYSKEKSARISNSAWKKKRMGIATNTPTSVQGIVKAWVPELGDDWATILSQAGLVWKDDQKSGHGPHGSHTVRTNRYDSQEDGVPKIKKEDLPTEVVEYIDTLESHVEEVEAENTALTDTVTKQDAELADLRQKAVEAGIAKGDPLADVLAKADPAVRAVLEKQAADNAELAAKVAKAEQDRIDAEMIAKAERLPMISTDKASLAAILKAAHNVPTEIAKADGTTEASTLGAQIESLLAAANEQIAKGNLFTEFGNGGGETTLSKSVESKAHDLMKADPNLTLAMAISKVYETNPDLYTESLKEG